MIKNTKVLAIIPMRTKREIPLLIGFMIIGAAFEVVGLSLIFPLMAIVTGDNQNFVLQLLTSYYPTLSQKNLIILSMIIFVSIYTLKALYLTFLAWRISRFTHSTKVEINNLLMQKYLGEPYEFHQNNNSAILIRNLTTESTQWAHNILNPILVIVAESTIIIAIVIFLVLMEPVGATTVGIIMIACSYLFQKAFGKYTSNLGKIRQNADGLLIKKSHEALGGIKEVKVLGKIEFFYEQFRHFNKLAANASAKAHLLRQVPRMYLETVAVLVFSVLLLLLTIRDGANIQVISALSAFALAAFRLLPSANRILASLNSVRFAEAVVDLFHEQLKDCRIDHFENKTKRNNDRDLTFNKTIKLKDLSYHYPNASKDALSQITFTIKKGQSIGIMGKSGAGKSTLSDIILGLLTPSSGKILVDHVDINENIRAWQHKIGYVQQDIYLLDDSIRQNIAFGVREDEVDEKRLSEVVLEAALDEFVSSLPDGLDTHLGERGVRLSGGQKQRIGIARALYRNPPILIFDEATSALDNATENEIVSAIQRLKGKRTIIVIAHRLSTIGHCDRVIELTDGRISRSRTQKEDDKVY